MLLKDVGHHLARSTLVVCFVLLLVLARSRTRQNREVGKPNISLDSGVASSSPRESPLTPVPAEPRLLVLHVGPGKTGTTSLQVDLSSPAMEQALRQDGYWFGGWYYKDAHLRESGEFIEGKPTFSSLLDVLREILIPRKVITLRSERQFCSTENELQASSSCWSTFRSFLDKESGAHGNASILLSDEPLALRWSPERFADLREILSASSERSLPWKSLVVVSYCRFYEWLPSSIYQRNRKRLQDTEWPSKGDLQALQQLWPNMATEWRSHHYTFLDSVADDATSAGVDYQILNIHNKTDSVRTNFLCQILPAAPSSCELSRRMDKARLYSTAKVNVRSPKKVRMLYYDILSTEAAERGLIDKNSFTRTQVREALQEYMEAKNQSDFEMYCPTSKELDQLLGQSLALEAAYIWPIAVAATSNPEVTLELEAEHRAGFNKMVESQAFCVVDTLAVSSNHELRQFFSAFSRSA